MNQKLYPVFIFFITLIFLSNAGNPPNGNTGAPGDGICTNCHGGSSGGLDGTVSISGLPSSIIANTKYALTVTIENLTTASKGGFQILALDNNNNNIGTFSNPGSNSAIQSGGGRTYFEHSTAKSFSGPGTLTYTVDWTSPATNLGQTITMYAAAILTNGNNNSSGDLLRQDDVSGTMPGPPPLNAIISAFKNVTCNGGFDGSITVSATNGVPPYTYLWSDGQTTTTAIGLNAKMHNVTVTDNVGSMLTLSKLLTEPPTINIASTGKKILTCFGAKDGSLNVNSSGGTGMHTYKWNTGLTTKNIANLAAGEFTVTVTDANNCTISETYSISQPDDILIEIKNIIKPACSNEEAGFCEAEATGGTGILKYKWSSAETTPSLANKKPGTYTVTVTDAANCTKSKSVNITVSDLIKPILSISQDTFSYKCNYVAKAPIATDNCGVKQLIQIEGTSVGDTFKMGTTRMRFKAIDSSNNETEITYHVQIENPLRLKVDTVIYDSCYGEINFIQFSMENKSNYWYELYFNNEKIRRFDSAFIVNYKTHNFNDTLIRVLDSFNCRVDTILIFDTAHVDYFAVLDLKITDASECKLNDGKIEISLTGKIGSFRWLDENGNPISNQSGQNLKAGKYYYEVSSKDLNDSTACKSSFGPFEVKCTTLSQYSKLDQINIYPNPVQNLLIIDNISSQKLDIRIISSSGNQIHKFKTNNNSKLELNLESYTEGLYFVEFSNEHSTLRRKILVIH